MKRRTLIQSLLILFLCAGLNFACLDVNPPGPGSPLDWVAWSPGLSTPMSDAVLTGMGEEKKPDVPDAPEDNRSSVADVDRILEQVPRAMDFRVSLDPWAECGVTTTDVPNHLKWWASQPKGFEPPVTEAFRLKMLANYVRLFCYPDLVPIPDLINYMIEVGEASHFAAEGVTQGDSNPQIGEVSKAVLDAVGDPMQPFAIPKEYTTFQRLIATELGNGHPYDAYDYGFGESIMALGPYVLPDLIQFAKEHPHKLIRHNAVYLLRFFGEPEATAALRELAAGDDRVSQNRAITALIKRKDSFIGPWLLKTIKDDKNTDEYEKHMCVYALGYMGRKNAEAVPTVLEWMAPGFKESKYGIGADYLWTGVNALGRMGADSKDAKETYARVLKKFGARTNRMHQATLFAQAAYGNMDAIKELWDLMKGMGLAKFDGSVLGMGLEVLADIQGKIGKDLLMEIVNEKRNHILMRYHALRLKACQRKDEDMLKEMASDQRQTDPIMRATAMLKLFGLNPPLARQIAYKVVESFAAGNRTASMTGAETNEVVLALQLLGPAGDLKYEQLGTILDYSLQLARRSEQSGGANDLETKVQFQTAPVFETALLELARLQSPQAEQDLLKVLLDPSMPNRKMAARALGLYGTDLSTRKLIDVLEDMKDPWVRFFANESLQHITGVKCGECDWFSTEQSEIKKGVTFWNKWYAETHKAGDPEPQGDN